MKCIQEISQHLRVALAPPNNPHIAMMRSLLEMTMQLRITQNHVNVLTLLQKVDLIHAMHSLIIEFLFYDCHQITSYKALFVTC